MPGHRPSFDELYVVSDLHLGGHKDGDENFQVFNNGPRLSAFITHLAGEHPEHNIALVLNGDVLDSLAEDAVPSYVALNETTLLRMMAHLYEDASFAPIWDALAKFVSTPRRHLVFVIGNHDIELALPMVEHSIRHRLTDGDVEASARIHFSSHGGGYACRVGNAQVFCSHGNEVDEWNWVDYSALGQLANAINCGRSVSPSRWRPNAGTMLVVDVMNTVKRRFPFIDLLKPEVAAVSSVLMTLDRELFRSLNWRRALPILARRKEGLAEMDRVLGAYASHSFAETAEEVPGNQDDFTPLLGPNLREAIVERSSASEDELLLAAARATTEPGEAVSGEEIETLGMWDLVKGGLGLITKEEALRRALQDWLEDDRSFELTKEDALFNAMRPRVADTIDFVVTGHTHQPRAISFEDNRHYFNCGTWIRTLRLTPEVLNDEQAFATRLWPALRAGRMDALDNVMIPGDGKNVPLVCDRTFATHIADGGKRVVGRLLRVSGAGPGDLKVAPEKGTTKTVPAR